MKNGLIKINEEIFATLIAESESEHSTGLMYQKKPLVMSFPYKEAMPRRFWMKNTPLPLDIVFCKEGKVIDICKGEPYSTTLVGPEEPSDLVLEFPYGTMDSNNIEIGAPVSLAVRPAQVE